MNTLEKTRRDFLDLCADIGTTAMDEENAILSVGREFLPPCALVVLDGGMATPEYYDWLAEQTRTAQNEYDRDNARKSNVRRSRP